MLSPRTYTAGQRLVLSAGEAAALNAKLSYEVAGSAGRAKTPQAALEKARGVKLAERDDDALDSIIDAFIVDWLAAEGMPKSTFEGRASHRADVCALKAAGKKGREVARFIADTLNAVSGAPAGPAAAALKATRRIVDDADDDVDAAAA